MNMDLEKRIVLLFIANNVERFEQWLKDEKLPHVVNLDYLGNVVMTTANELDINPNLVLHNPFAKSNKNQSKSDLKETLVNNDRLLAAIESAGLDKIKRDWILEKANHLSGERLERVIDSLNLLGSTASLGIAHLANEMFKHGFLINVDYTMVLFVSQNKDLFVQWINSLNSIKPKEKIALVTGWLDRQIEEKQVLSEMFCGNNDLESVA